MSVSTSASVTRPSPHQLCEEFQVDSIQPTWRHFQPAIEPLRSHQLRTKHTPQLAQTQTKTFMVSRGNTREISLNAVEYTFALSFPTPSASFLMTERKTSSIAGRPKPRAPIARLISTGQTDRLPILEVATFHVLSRASCSAPRGLAFRPRQRHSHCASGRRNTDLQRRGFFHKQWRHGTNLTASQASA